MTSRHAKEIIKHLDRTMTGGVGQYQVFEDWLDMVHAALTTLPSHLRSAIKEGRLEEDTPETADLFARFRERYTPSNWQHFAAAFVELLASADGAEGLVEWQDTIGDVYMEWGIPNKHTGQFFTPYHVSRMSAQVIMGDVEERIYERIEMAYLKTRAGLMHSALTGPERVSAFVRENAPSVALMCAEYVAEMQIRVSDPACGSGSMLLAAAEQCPRWALNLGLVQFYGQDIDMTCVKMAQVNLMIYGLNGYNLKNVLAMSEADLQATPEPWQSAYREAQSAAPELVQEIAVEVNAWRQGALL